MDVQREWIVAVLVRWHEAARLILHLRIRKLVQRLYRRHFIECALVEDPDILQASLARSAARTIAEPGETAALVAFEEELAAEPVVVFLLLGIDLWSSGGCGRAGVRGTGEGSIRRLVIGSAKE